MGFISWWGICIAAAAWVYVDANGRGNAQAPFWAIFAFFAPVLGVPVYLAIGRRAGGPAPASLSPAAQKQVKPGKPGTGPLNKAKTGPLNAKRLEEPAEIQDFEDLGAFFQLAIEAARRDEPQEAARLMGRLYREAALGDLKILTEQMGKAWLESVKPLTAAQNVPVLVALIEEAAAAIAKDDMPKAAQLWRRAVSSIQDMRQHPGGPLVLLGLEQAIREEPADPIDMLIETLIKRGTQAMLDPGRAPEALEAMRQALSLVPDPPRDKRDAERRARITAIMPVLEAAAADAAGPPWRSKLGSALDALGPTRDPGDAIRHLEAAIAAIPADSAEPHDAVRRARLEVLLAAVRETASVPVG